MFQDARSQFEEDRPVTGSVGPFAITTPAVWFLACLLLPEFVLPVYLDGREYA